MLEAVNSVVSNAPLLKAATPQVSQPVAKSVSRSDYINVESTNFTSRFVSLDETSRRAVLQIRDSSTGESLRQFPTESQIRAYLQAQSTAETVKATESGKTPPSPTEQKAQVAATPDIYKPDALTGQEISQPSPSVSKEA
ncbi:MAG: hypothetical protein ACPG05_04095 [Bdellovibrionales bacterium]